MYNKHLRIMVDMIQSARLACTGNLIAMIEEDEITKESNFAHTRRFVD